MTFSFLQPSATSISTALILLESALDPDLEQASLTGLTANGCLGMGILPVNALLGA